MKQNRYPSVTMIVLQGLLLLMSLAAFTGCPGPGVTIVDSDGDVGRHNALAIGTGRMGIAYYDADRGQLKYAEKSVCSSGKWTEPVVVDDTGDVGRFVSLCMDSSDSPRVSYHDRTEGDLKYGERTSGGWVVQTVVSPGMTGMHTSLALDQDGQPWISFYDYDLQRLMLAGKTGAGWLVETVGPVPVNGINGKLVLDKTSGTPIILFLDLSTQRICCATKQSETWSIATVDSQGPFQDALDVALDPSSQTLLAAYFSAGRQEIQTAVLLLPQRKKVAGRSRRWTACSTTFWALSPLLWIPRENSA